MYPKDKKINNIKEGFAQKFGLKTLTTINHWSGCNSVSFRYKTFPNVQTVPRLHYRKKKDIIVDEELTELSFKLKIGLRKFK